MLIQLPNGLMDGVDHFNYADVDELRGKQQNYLANQELVVGNIGHVPKILEDMLLSLQTKEGLAWKGDKSKVIWKLPTGDLETLLIKIRENTYGEKFYHGAKCTHCGHEMKDLLLKLPDLKIEPMPVEEMLKPKKVSLPKSEIEVELRPTYMRDLFDMIKITTNSQDKLITSLVPLSIKSFKVGKGKEAKVIDPIKSEHIEELPMKDLMFLQESVGKVKLEGTIDTNIEMECGSCHKDFSAKLNVFDASFFDPSKGSTSGTM
jgi:hypothetical protein